MLPALTTAAEPQVAETAAASRSEMPSPMPAALRAPSQKAGDSASWLSRIADARERIAGSIPPRWLEVARQYPVLWLAVAPTLLALSLILLLLAFEPEPSPEAARPEPTPRAVAPAAARQHEPAVPPALAASQPDEQRLAAIEGKDPASLSVEELLLLNERAIRRKREEVTALSRKLQAQADLASDSAVQQQLVQFAADPATAADALAAMAQIPSSIGPDLLFEIWTNRSLPPGTAELARSLLYSREVRSRASAALAVALELRGADSCEAVQAVLPKAQAEGDQRSLPALSKLTSRRGCGGKKLDDCYGCLRAGGKQITAATKAAKARRAPSYPTAPAK